MITKEKKEIGNRIRFLLKKHQTSQTDVARKLDEQTGIGFKAAKTKVNRIIQGKTEADYDFWTCLYDMLSPNIGYLIAEKGEPYVKPFK